MKKVFQYFNFRGTLQASTSFLFLLAQYDKNQDLKCPWSSGEVDLNQVHVETVNISVRRKLPPPFILMTMFFTIDHKATPWGNREQRSATLPTWRQLSSHSKGRDEGEDRACARRWRGDRFRMCYIDNIVVRVRLLFVFNSSFVWVRTRTMGLKRQKKGSPSCQLHGSVQHRRHQSQPLGLTEILWTNIEWSYLRAGLAKTIWKTYTNRKT